MSKVLFIIDKSFAKSVEMTKCVAGKRCPKGYVKSKKEREMCSMSGMRTCSAKRTRTIGPRKAPKSSVKKDVMEAFKSYRDMGMDRSQAMSKAWEQVKFFQ